MLGRDGGKVEKEEKRCTETEKQTEMEAKIYKDTGSQRDSTLKIRSTWKPGQCERESGGSEIGTETKRGRGTVTQTPNGKWYLMERIHMNFLRRTASWPLGPLGGWVLWHS